MDKQNELQLAQSAMKWHGWGSPVGLGIFIVSLALTALIVAYTINIFVDTGQKGVDIERQIQQTR